MKHKQKGGAFTGNQLHDLLEAGYAKDESLATVSIKIIPLDKTNSFLFNETFQVFIEPDNVRFIVIHRGTEGTMRDWGNNVRNMIFGNKRSEDTTASFTTTNRQLVAENGYKYLRKYLAEIYANRNSTNITELQKKIIASIDNLMRPIDPQIGEITITEAIEQLLKTRMSVLGHSQGAVYAYLYGNDGVETIVYNPAPFKGKKPDNVYIIRRKGDPVSVFTRSASNSQITTLDTLSGKSMAEQHSIEPLNGVKTIFGNKYIFSKDIEIENGKQPSSVGTIDAYDEEGKVIQSSNKDNIGTTNNQIQTELNGEPINNNNIQSPGVPPVQLQSPVVPPVQLQPITQGGKIKKKGYTTKRKLKKRVLSRKIKKQKKSRK